MNSFLDTLMRLSTKGWYFFLQYTLTIVQWKLKLLRVQGQKWKRCGAQKQMQKAATTLGMEIYSLYKSGETNYQQASIVQQDLKLVEEAESMIFHHDEMIEEIDRAYMEKKEEIRERYTAKRSEIDEKAPEA